MNNNHILNDNILILVLSYCPSRLKELEASIRSQVAAEEKAHKIVERLVLEDEISEDFFIHSVSSLVFCLYTLSV